jgi:hypothetical protein
MKRFLIALTLFLIAGVCLVALSNSANRKERELQANQTAWQTQTQQLAEIQSDTGRLKEVISDRKQKLRSSAYATAVDPAVAAFLLTNDIKFASSGLQNQTLASFGLGGNSSDGYVLVSKAALANSNLRPLKTFPNGEKLTDEVRGVLAITTEEQRQVESAFAEAFDVIETWAKENTVREGPTDEMLVRYTIPADAAFQEALTNKLFSTINSAVGTERGELLHNYFDHNRLYEDGAIGDRTNILSIHRITASPGYGKRSGWKWDHSESINTYPEPIKTNNFPYAFRFVFSGGWEEVAKREGFELPDEFKNR